jgi:hypothetical protein
VVVPLTMNLIQIFVPYFDSVSGSTKYTEIVSGCTYDGNSGYDDSAFMVGIFNWLNKINPDWNKIKKTVPRVFPNLSGEGFVPAVDCVSANVIVTNPGAVVDRWYKSDSIAKYGICMPRESEIFYGPINWLNTKNSYFDFDQPNSNNLYYFLQPDVTATIIANVIDPSSQQASPSIPPVMAYMSHYLGNFPLPTDQTPFSVAGPELVP